MGQRCLAGFAVGGVTVGLVSADLLAAGAGDGLDQVVALILDAQRGVVDFDGDDLAGITQRDLDALVDDLGAPRHDTVRWGLLRRGMGAAVAVLDA